jgi:hypothetical protein
MKRITLERPKVDHIAYPLLIKHFVDMHTSPP